MTWTFGAAAGDRIVNTGMEFQAGTALANLVWIWAYPTTLTATRNYWGTTSLVTGLRVDTTTDELRFVLDCNTTDGEWTTSDADITVNNWWFIAWAWASTNGPAVDMAAWVGSPSDPPRLLTAPAVAVAASGNPTATPGAFRTGQGNLNTTNFQGNISHNGLITCNAAASATLNPMGLSSYSTISADEEQILLERFVRPAWAGDYQRLGTYGTVVAASTTSASFVQKMENSLMIDMQRTGSATVGPLVGTTGGSVAFTTTAGPRGNMVDVGRYE